MLQISECSADILAHQFGQMFIEGYDYDFSPWRKKRLYRLDVNPKAANNKGAYNLFSFIYLFMNIFIYLLFIYIVRYVFFNQFFMLAI